MNRKKSKKYLIGFLFVVVLAAIITFATYWNLKKTYSETEEYYNTLKILRTTETLFGHSQDMETGLRGLFLSHKTKFLRPYLRSKFFIERDTIDFKNAIKASLVEQDGVEFLRQIRIKLNLETMMIADYKIGKYDHSYFGPQLTKTMEAMDSIRLFKDKIETRMRLKLISMNKVKEQAAFDLFRLFSFIALLIISLLVFAGRSLYKHNEFEKKIIAFNQLLEKEVKDKTEELAHIFNRMAEGIIAFDKSGVLVYANTQMDEFLGVPVSNFVGENWKVLSQSELINDFYKQIRTYLINEVNTEVNLFLAPVNRHIIARLFFDGEGSSIFLSDISKQKESEFRLIESEKKYRDLFYNNPMAMWVIDIKNTKIMDVNGAAEIQYGYTKTELLELDISRLRPQEDIPEFLEYLNTVKQIELSEKRIWRHLKKNGEILIVEVSGHHILFNGIEARLVLLNDVSKQKKAEEDLNEKTKQLRLLNKHMETAREGERMHIAREIHDQLGQQLTALKLDASWLKRHSEGLPEIQEKAKKMIDLLNYSTETLRTIGSNLRPVILDDMGLVAAIEWLVREFKKNNQIECTLDISDEFLTIPIEKSITIFRICQESLTNITKHAQASFVKIELHNNEGITLLSINDNGKGFIREETDTKNRYGLLGMEERANIQGGELVINSKSSIGTSITLRLPW